MSIFHNDCELKKTDLNVVIKMIKDNFRAIRKNIQYHGAHIRVTIEAQNNWYEPQRLQAILQEYAPISFTHDPKSGNIGVPTGLAHKIGGSTHLIRHLATDTLKMVSNEAMITTQKVLSPKMLLEQMRFYRNETEPVKSLYTEVVRQSQSGKAGGRKDDRVIALLLGLFWAYVNITNQWLPAYDITHEPTMADGLSLI